MIDIDKLDLMNQPDEGDPLIWIRKHRNELAEKYPTIKELSDYYQTIPSTEEIAARLKREMAEEKRQQLETATK